MDCLHNQIELVIGLRNPGADYEKTRHNAGAWFVDAMLKHYPALAPFSQEKKLRSSVTTCSVHNHTYKIALPTTYMNESGQAVQALSQFYHIPPEKILIIHDDLDLPVGTIRLKTGGGHGGHNGLRNIIAQWGTSDFHRLRIGIGHPGNKEAVLHYVLHSPSVSDRHAIIDAIDRVMPHVPTILEGHIDKAMHILHTES